MFFLFSVIDDLDNISIVVTLITEESPSEHLKNLLKEELMKLLRFSLFDMKRFGKKNFNYKLRYLLSLDGCTVEPTIIPPYSNESNLTITLIWPETNIGRHALVNCPCGSETSGDKGLNAIRFCGGNFVDGAQWLEANVGPCNFSSLARQICQLFNVGNILICVKMNVQLSSS